MEQPTNADTEAQAMAVLEQMANFAGLNRKAAPRAPEVVASEGGGGGATAAKRGWQPDLRYRSLVERLPVVTFMASLDDTLQELYISPQIETLLGFTQEEWLDNPILWFRQLHPDDRERWVAGFAETCSTGAHFRAEYRLLARDGRVVWVQGECQVIRDDEGRPSFLQGLAFDITHLKNAALVEEARLAAEAASSAKSEFLARMSHEIRTPLNGVVGMIDLLRSTGMTEIQDRYAHLARESADSLMAVINDILDFSKIEAGKVEIEAVEFDICQLAEDLTELLAPLAAKKQLALACFLGPEVPHHLIGDPNRIRQVLTNLVNNALKFTAQGHVGIRVAMERAQGEDIFLRLQVEDSGIGIPADRIDRLFKSFSQVDSSTTRKFGGTGLGLAISKRLVELMDGEIGIESVEGEGTTFWFTLKVGKCSTAEALTAGGPAEALRSVRVMAIEPDATYRRILTEQLKGRLCPTSVVTDSAEALGVLYKASELGKPFDVALISYATGARAALATAIQSDPRLRQTKLIAVMDIDDRTDAAAIKQAGFVGRLHRPLIQSKVLDVIASATVQRANLDVAAAPTPAAGGDNPLKGLHLLVAEDNEMNQFVTQETLRRVGCTCDIVADGQLAVEALGKRKYDVVLMDCQMPRMDGLEAAREIRKIEAAAGAAGGSGGGRVPIIALTAEAIQGDREKCIAAGMDGYVSKPIHAAALFAAVEEVMRARKPLRAAEETVQATAPTSCPLPLDFYAGAKGGDHAAAAGVSAEEAAAPIDVEALCVRCMNDMGFATQTLKKFHVRALEDVKLLRSGIAASDIQGTTRLAHNLKSVAAHVAAGPLSKIAFEIEQAGISRDLAVMEQQLAELDEEARRCVAFIPGAIERIARMPRAAMPFETR